MWKVRAEINAVKRSTAWYCRSSLIAIKVCYWTFVINHNSLNVAIHHHRNLKVTCHH